MPAPDPILSDNVKLLDNAITATFRITSAPARLAVDGPGTLYAWQGNDWDAGEAFTGSTVIAGPGLYKITLDGAGYATIQENEE